MWSVCACECMHVHMRDTEDRKCSRVAGRLPRLESPGRRRAGTPGVRTAPQKAFPDTGSQRHSADSGDTLDWAAEWSRAWTGVCAHSQEGEPAGPGAAPAQVSADQGGVLAGGEHG